MKEMPKANIYMSVHIRAHHACTT